MRLISFLGTGNYQATRYFWPVSREYYDTPYVTVALARLLKTDEVLILATEKARETHGRELKQAFAEAKLPSPRVEKIAEGKTQKELWENFEHLVALLRGGQQDVVLDVTHGFRSQPFFAGAVVSFVRAIEDNPPPIQVVYGAFEARSADNQTPIWDLTAFVDLLDWTRAIRAFLRSGQGEELVAKAEALGRYLAKEWATGHKEGRPPRVKKFAKALKTFSQMLSTVRVGELLLARDDHPSAARRLAQAAEEASADIKAHIPPIAQVLEEIQKMLEGLLLTQDHLASPEGQRAMSNLARLYLQLGRYAEAAIILREGWVNLYASPEATRPGDRFDDKARRLAEQSLTRAGYTERELMGLRNDLEHGGFRTRPLPAESIREQLERFVAEFEHAQPAKLDPKPVGTTWFVSRHPGAVEWARRHGIQVDRLVDHLMIDQISPGDTVIGTLPINLAAQVCARGARLFNLCLDLPPEVRGKELSADELEQFCARIEEYWIERGQGLAKVSSQC